MLGAGVAHSFQLDEVGLQAKRVYFLPLLLEFPGADLVPVAILLFLDAAMHQPSPELQLIALVYRVGYRVNPVAIKILVVSHFLTLSFYCAHGEPACEWQHCGHVPEVWLFVRLEGA